jgi:hypothetical protein
MRELYCSQGPYWVTVAVAMEKNPSAGEDQVVEYDPFTVVVCDPSEFPWPWRENLPIDWKPVCVQVPGMTGSPRDPK